MAIIDKLTAIGDAIREKTGGTAELTLDQMVTEIGGISGGGGDTTTEDALIQGGLTNYSDSDLELVGKYAFSSLQNLKTVDLPNVKSVDNDGFLNCFNLETVNIPNVISIYGTAFKFCNKLTSIDFPVLSTLHGTNTFNSCEMLTSVVFPNLTSWSTYTFNTCKNLKKVDLYKVTTIPNHTFTYCSNLTTLILRNTAGAVTLTATNAFLSTPFNDTPIPSEACIYVPDELVEDYKVATNWVTYANQIKPLSEYVEVTE